MSDRRGQGMSPASSYASLSGTFTPGSASPRESPRGTPRGQSPAPGRLGSSLPLDIAGHTPRVGAGIQMAIQNLQHEQERVQKKTFTNWMNTYLKQRSEHPRKVEELFSEIKDGVVLLSLLEILSGEKLPMEKGPRLKRPHHLSNISTALSFLDKKKIKMVNINATDIADAKPSIVLGLIWTIILYFQIEETISSVPNVGDIEGDGPSKKKKPAMPKQSLLAWADGVLAKKYGLKVTDFGKSWRDGVAFNAMIHNIRPDLVDMDEVRRQNARVNLEHAFSTAEDELGIPRLLDPEDVDVEKPDEKSVMTYVATILKAYPDAGDPNFQGVPSLKMDTPEQETQAFNALMNWLNQEAKDTLEDAQQPVTDRQAELKEYMAFKADMDKREPVYRKIGEKVMSGTAVKLTKSDWEKLNPKWLETEDLTQRWLLKLDMSLPGRLGQFGRWLYDAERLLEKREQPVDDVEQMTVQIGTLLQEHKAFFKDLEAQKQFFQGVKRSGRYEGEFLDKAHLDLLSQRTERVAKMAPRRQRRLEYLETRYILEALLLLSEQKAAQWTVKYGRQETVEMMLQDYQSFVVKDKLLDKFKRTQEDTRKKAEMYKNNGGDPVDINEMTRALGDISGRWEKTSAEIQRAGTGLKEAHEAWKTYNPCVEALAVWLTDGERVMQQSMEEKQAFFETLPEFEAQHRTLNESGNYLIDITDPAVATEVRETLALLNRRYTELTDGYTNFQKVEVIGRARDEYAEGTRQIEGWLQNADGIVGPQIPCIHAELKEHLQQLDLLGSQVPEIESVFKTTTKTAQSLVKDSSSDVVNDMLRNLNTQKEVILQLRKEIPDRSKVLKSVLPNVESLETGIFDLNKWLDKGEQLLQTHRLDGSGEATEARLERHKAFFSEITYQKSILESKNKVYQKVVGVKGKLKSVDFTPAEEMMDAVNKRFQNCVKSAKDWEKQLENLVRLWRSLQQKQNALSEWLDNAESVLEDKDDDPESLIRKHKLFFDRVNKRILQDYLSVGEEILAQLEEQDQAGLRKEMTALQDRWNNIHYHAPIKLLKLEFAVPEDKFLQKVIAAENAIKQHQEQLAHNVNVKETLLKHRQLFQESDLVPTCEKCLGSMETLSKQLLDLSQEERSLWNRYEDHLQRWKRLHSVSENTHEQLKQLPQRWKDYNTKLGEVSRWIMDVEGLMKDMQKEDLSSDEYKEMLARFQQAMRNKSKYMDDAKWLSENLQELLKDEPNADGNKERARLQEIMDKFGKLDSGMKNTSDKSSVFSKSFEYRDNLERRANWLDETQKQVMEHPPIDSLDDARAYLQEHESRGGILSIMSRLEAEAPNIQADIEAGKRLQRERNAPSFVGKTVDDLSRKWKDTNELARAKLAKLQSTVRDWEKYEGEKTQLVQYLKKAEAELEKPTAINGQDMAHKDLQAKKELHSTLNKLKGNISEMQKLNAALAEGASRERRTPLKTEMSDIDKRLENVSVRLNAKLADLEATIAKWSEYYNRLNNFCDWLNEKETKLNDVYENKRDMPDQQLTKAEAIASEVYENHITLETLEKDARGLSNNFRSRETAALKSKLTTLRRQWESLCARAKDRSTTLSGNVLHWQEYQRLQEQLMPWILKAEKYCTTEPPKCASLEEAKDLYDVHQAFLQECEEHLPLFEKMSTEAGYLMEQPDMPRELEIIQGRWGHILNASEERTHRMDKMFGAWTAFDEEQDNFVETLQKFQKRLAQEPNTASTDIQVLEHELALAKALQDEIRSQQPQMNALQRRHEQVQPYATPAGLEKLRNKQEEIKDIWNNINSSVLDRQKVVNTALQHRRDFYGRMQDFEKWLKKVQRKLDTGSEIYSDEVAEELAKLKALRGECGQHDPVFQALQQEFKEMMQNCSKDEAAVLSDRFDKIMDNYTKIEDLIQNRENLCENWTKYSDDHKDTQAKLKALQARLQSPDLTEEEVAQIKREIAALKQGMAEWNKQAEGLDDLMGTAQMVIKDRATQRTLHFNTELQNLDHLCDTVADVAQQRQEHLGELSQLGDEFVAKKDDLVIKLQKIQDKIANAAVDKSSLQGLKELIREVEDIRDDMYTYNPEYEQLRELGRQIMQSDPSKAHQLQSQLSEVNQVWEGVQAAIADKHQYLNSVGNMWQQYNEAKTGVVRVLDDVEPLVNQEISFTNHADVKKSLDQHKNAEFELHANQTQLDHMNTKGLELLKELAKVPGFNLQSVEADLDEVNHNWETANKTIIDDHRENLEAQLVCWDQLQSGKDEVANWVNSMVGKLDDSLKNFDDAVSVEARLLKFKEEAPYFEEVLKEVSQKMNDLKELNGGRDLPGLERETQDIIAKFEKASDMAGQLQTVMENYSDEQKQLQNAIDAETEWMNKMKDKLAKCDDVTGSDDDLIARLMASKELQEEFAQHKQRMADIQAKTRALQSKYPSAEVSNLAKDANVMAKKFDALESRAERIEDSLTSTLEQHCQEAQVQQARWLNQAKEKVAWCDDLAGDRYSVEAKLSTIKDLMSGLEDGEQKRAAAAAQLEKIKAVLPKSKQAELEAQKNAMDREWNSLVGQMEQTQNKLETSIDQFTDYDGRYDDLSQWLKETEAKMRNLSSLKPDLEGKQEQQKVLQELEAEVAARRREFEELRDNAQDISRATGDNRTASYAGQLLNRFQSLAEAVKDQNEKCDSNIADHEDFNDTYTDAMEWLKSAQRQLEECEAGADDEDALRLKLATIQDLLVNKDEGLARFNAALEHGEKLYPNTSNQGRENIRRELRALRDTWENFQDKLNDTQRQLETSRMQWSSFDENFEQLAKWIDDTESHMMAEPELKNSLQEKKAQLQQYKTRYQDIMSHQSMVDSISDKGAALASGQVQNKLKQLNQKYKHLCSLAQTQVKRAEEHVDQHQQFHDHNQQCRDWITSTRDKLAVCSEVSGDRQALQNRLDRVKDLQSGLNEGEAKLRSTHQHGEKTLPQTAPQGQMNIQREMESLDQEWQGLEKKMSDMDQGLVQALGALESYDGSCETLGRWLRDAESKVKDAELKSTLEEKQKHVDDLKALQREIEMKQGEFGDLQAMASQVQGADARQIGHSTQLATKYEGLKAAIKDSIRKWQDNADEQQSYENNLAQSNDWIDTLRKRLEVCGDLAGDKQDVEDRLAKLQELAAEKDSGRLNIMQTIDAGEKLYPSTASEGREIIRQDIRNLRENWDLLCDEVAATQRKLECSMLEWSAYDDSFEQFQKWLLDAEVKLREDGEMKATLPDKKAQLQNHKVLHQDILSRQHIMSNLVDKARSLTQSSPAAKVNKFVTELQGKYQALCETSKDVLGKLETSVKDHQQYQDAYHDLQDWLNLSREKLDSCADRSGDRLSLQSKQERLKEFANSAPTGEKKLHKTSELCEKTAKNTSPQGCEVLKREIEHLQREWDDYVSLMQQVDSSLNQAMVQWGDFETKFEACADWLKQMEQAVKSHELKSTLKEKQTQVDKFKKQREEILSHQPEIDRFTDEAQNLMHTSSDVRLSTQVSQLTNRYQGLLSLVKDLINKWEKYVHEHQTYDSRLNEFNQWLSMANQRLSGCQQPVGDQETMEEKRAVIQILFSEKEHGLQKLNLAIEAGEKLFPDTASQGRDKVRHDLRTAKEDWEKLFNGLNDAQRKVDAFLMQWSSYADGQEQLMRWLMETETALRADVDVKNTLQEKRMQLQNHRSLLQDITSHQRLVDSVVEKAQGVLQSTSNSDVATFITSISSRYEKLAADAKNLIGKSEQNMTYHQNYQDTLQAALDWMTQVKDRQSMCADTSGDRLTIQNKLDRLHELVTTLPDGVTKIKDCERNAELTMDTTALKGRQTIQQEMDVLKLDWEDYTLKLNSLKENLEQALHYWTIYDEKYDKVMSWLKGMEKQVKDVPLRSTLEEKQEQHAACQELMQEIRGKQRDIDKFSDEAQTLQQLTGESRVGNFVSQLSNRYQTLLTNTKDLIKKSGQNVDDHKQFKEKYNDCSQWLAKAKAKFAECSDSGGSRAELENKLERAQDLLRERDAGFSKLTAAMESGERLYPSTAPDGRESIRQDLRRLKMDWESMFDDLSAIQRKLEVALVQWTSFDDSYSQVGNWLREMEMQLEGPVVFRATLEEKKSQLLNYKALHQDVLSYQRVMDSITDKAQSLAQSSSDPQLASFISQTGARYKKLCSAAKDRVQQYDVFVTDHQEYNDAYNACVEWLNGIREKLSVCSDISGDRHAIQSRLDKIQRRCDILATKMEGEPRVKNVIQLAEKVLPNTAPQGKDIIRRETEALKDDWEAFITALAKTKSDLETCMDQWKEFESWHDRCASWMKESEAKLRDTELKATLQDKQSQLEKLKALQADVADHQSDLDALSDSAQDLVRMSTDTRVVSQASQLATKYQTLSVNVKELCRRWEQYVLDHQAYTQSFDQCKTWIGQMKVKVTGVADTTGDKTAIQDKIKDVQNLLSEKEEGLHMLQIALDNLQIVLPNTSVTGRDNMRRDMQALQQEFDVLAGELNETRTGLEGCLAQWTVYDDSVEQLHRWLRDLENQVEAESQLQNTLQEKKLQLDRVKVLQLNITSQQSTIDNMNDKANTLQQTSKDANLSNQIHQIVARYETLQTKAKKLLHKCETNLRDHQLYRDTYLEATDWLSTTKDRLNLCSDVRGDRHAVEAQLHKVQEIGNSLETGQKKLNAVLEKGNKVLPETSDQGQELVRQELDMLSGEFQVLDTDLQDLLNTLENLRDQWHRYEEYYDELSHWIKDTEADMKADSEQKATLEDKIVQLDKQKGMHDEILRQQTAFDGLAEQAQILMQLSKDSRVSTQLTQMSSRYSGLISLSKDLMKRYDQHVQDHQQYAEMYNDSISWLQSTRDRLSVCADTSGDRYTIQTQLEKLQEFSVLKEEGQALLHTANTWGEKTMTNTSVTGREMIRQELQQLQTDWADLLSEVSDTKVLLEACLLRWTEFSDSHDQVLRWMKDMEKKLRETQPKADIGEKRAELQRVKVLYQDIISYEQMIESVSTKAHGLAEKSPSSLASTDTSQIATRYTTVKDQAKELLAKNEQYVANHQDYIDACNNFVSWLRTAIEKLATCSDTFGERSVIEGKIERVQSLLHNLSEGTQRLSHATKAGEATLPSTSPQGQTKIRQELQTMHKDFDEFRGQLVQAQSDLEVCLTRWEEFEESYQAFAQWLKDIENQVRSELDLKTTVEEKKLQWELYQRQLEEIISHQSALDRVSEKAQALLQTNADAKTSHAITQITTRYQAVIAHCKDIVSNLEFYFTNHMTYKHNLQQFQAWLRETRQHIQTLEDDRGSREKVTARLEHAEEIQSAMDQGHSLLRALLDSCEKTLPSTSNKGCQTLRQETEAAKTDYENLLTDMSQAKRSLENALSHWGDFDRLYDQLNHWLTDVENKLRTEPENKADLPEKRSNMEKFKAIQADIAAHKDQLGKLEEKASQVKDSGPRGHVAGLMARYQAVITESKDAFMKAEEEVKGHEEYRKAYIACLDWLANTKHRLQRLSDYSGDKRTLQDRLQQLKEFKSDLRQGQEMLNKAAALGERVSDRTSARGRPAIQQEVEGLREDWTAFSMAVSDVENNLESCIANWVELDDDHVAIMNWIDKMDKRVRGLMDPKPNLSRKQQQYQEGEDVYDEINAKKTALEKIREKGESIAQRSSDPRLSNSMMQLSTKFQALCSLARSNLQKLKDNVHDHRLYDDALESAAKWLALMSERVQACSDTAGDWTAIQERIADIKDVTASMDDGLQKVNYVCDMAEKILPSTSTEGKRTIEEQVTEMTNEWEKLNSAINECTAMLEGVQQRWHEYEEYYGSIVKWLAEIENQLQLDPEPRAQLAEKKTQLDKYKMILADIDHRQRLVNELADRVANLEALCNNPDVSDSLTDVQNRYDAVRNRARTIVSDLQASYDDHLDFHESQQDCEKWLLQTSFRLMSHNSLNVSSLELTQRQIDKHRALIHEIEDYRLTLDGVGRKGQQLIVSTPRLPRLAQHVQSQLQNLEESYVNLQSTAQQIKDRLQEVLEKWQQYKDLLDSTSRYLTHDFADWLNTNQAHSPDTLDEAQDQREAAQAMLEKLQAMRQEVATAAHRCENLGSMENLDQTEAAMDSSVSQLADSVNGQLSDSIREVERRLDHLREMIRQWDSVERERSGLRQWLHTKREEVQELERKPAKLHAEAAEIEIDRIKALRDEVMARGPAVDQFVSQYRSLTQHNPALADPVVQAVRDDWEELIGQLDNLISEREQALIDVRELQNRNDTMDEDLENYARALERIDKSDATMEDKGIQMKPQRRRCRSTQTPNTTQNLFDSFDSDTDGFDTFGPKRPRGSSGARGGFPGTKGRLLPTTPRAHNQSLNRSRNRGLNHSRRSERDLKKGAAAAAALESDSEESGYGDTFGGETMHASSFDTHLDEPSDWMGSETLQEEPSVFADSETESNASFVTGIFLPVNPEDLRDRGSQTPGHARTQTDSSLFARGPRTVQTQTETPPHSRSLQASNTSLHSIGNQTRKKSNSRANLLRSILSDVKEIKRQQGLSSTNTSMRDDMSLCSDASIRKETLQSLYKDVQTLKTAGRQGDATTQTASQQSTQTSSRLFPEGDRMLHARQGRFQEIMDEVRHLRGGDRSAMRGSESRQSIIESPRTIPRTTPSRFDSPQPMSSEPAVAVEAGASASPGPYMNGYAGMSPPRYGEQFPMYQGAASMPGPPGPHTVMGRRRVTQEDLNAITGRLDRLRNLQVPPRRTLPNAAMFQQESRRVLPEPPQPPNRYRVREFVHSYDDMDLMGQEAESRHHSRRSRRAYDDLDLMSRDVDFHHYSHRSRRHHPGSLMSRHGLDNALDEAAATARQLKRMSSKMKRNLHDELSRY